MIQNLLFSRADWYRPSLGKDATNSQGETGDVLKQRAVPCNIQPATAAEVNYYMQRSMEVSHTIYTAADPGFARNDKLKVGATTYHVIGVRDLITLGRVFALDCLEFRGGDGRE